MDRAWCRQVFGGSSLKRLKLGLCLWVSATSLALGGGFSTLTYAATIADHQVQIDIGAGPLDAALQRFAAQTHQQLLYTAEIAAGRRVGAVKGSYTPDEALQLLLRGTGIEAQRTAPNVLVLRPRSGPIPTAFVGSALQAGAIADAPSPQASPDAGAPALVAPSPTPPDAARVAEVVVTGTHIRGVLLSPSPVTVVTRDDMDRQGYATVADALQALPQNFGGAGNEQAVLSGADKSNVNNMFASGVNLRGLGADATLVLINGRRMAGTGTLGDFADISTLPAAAVERIEVLTDGASALYGSDAVGGVVNVLMRQDFDGAETRLHYGAVTDGPTGEVQLGQTFGASWTGGNALIAYEYNERTALPSSARAYADNADLTGFGGTDHRVYYSNPGTILTEDPVTGNFLPAYAIPKGQNGVGLTPGDFVAGTENLQNQREGVDILPRQERHSLYASVNQALGDRVEFSADFRWGWRHFEAEGAAATALLEVTPSNPYFVSPNGAPYDLIGYSFQNDIGNTKDSGTAESLGTTLGADIRLFGDWRLGVYGAYAQEDGSTFSGNTVNSGNLYEALGLTPDNPDTSFSTAKDGYFNPFGAGVVNSKTVTSFIGEGFETSFQQSRVETLDLNADGTLIDLPGGPAKLAIGAQVRHEGYSFGGSDFTQSSTLEPTPGGDYGRTVSAAYAELRIPVFGPQNRLPGLDRLELSAAGRFEHYSDFGSTENPKLGLIWSPAKRVVLRTSYGTSFRAPALPEVFGAPNNSPTYLPMGSTNVLTMILYGGNRNLKPETADSWTTSLDVDPVAGLHLGATWFRTRFTNRIGQPALQNVYTVLSDPAEKAFVSFINPAGNAADLARITALLNSPLTNFAGLFPAQAYGAIVDARYVNTSSLLVSGLDLHGDYRIALGRNRFDLTASGSYLFQYDQQVTPTAPVEELVNTPEYPLHFRGRATGTWTRGILGATLGVNYTDSYHNATGRTVDAWTTVDAQVRVQLPKQAGVLNGVVLALNVQNLFDTAPPFYDAPEGIGYDSANASARGRFVSLDLTKRW